METDLSLVSTDDMIAELVVRCDGLLLCMQKNVTANGEGVEVIYRGGRTLAIGMAEEAKARMLTMPPNGSP